MSGVWLYKKKKKSSLNAWMLLIKFRLTWRIGLLILSSAGSGSALTFDPTLAGSSTHPWLVVSVNESKHKENEHPVWNWVETFCGFTLQNWNFTQGKTDLIRVNLMIIHIKGSCCGQTLSWTGTLSIGRSVPYSRARRQYSRNKYQHNQTPECSDYKLFQSSLNSYRTDHW